VTEHPAIAAAPAAGASRPLSPQLRRQLRAALAVHVLDLAEITRQRDLYAPVPGQAQALAHLSAGRAVALVGAPGTGRRITAINLLVRFGAWPSQVVLDPAEIPRLSAEPGQGYVLDAGDLGGQDARGAGTAVLRALDAARAARCYVIIRATPAVWRDLRLAGRVPAVELRPAGGIAVFRRHLAQRAGEDDVRRWSECAEIVTRIQDAAPAEAVRMAATVAAVISRGPRAAAGQLDDIAAAYDHWAGHLEEWFRKEHLRPDAAGRRRALLVASAVLETSPAALVLTAADQLARVLDLPPEPGHGLASGGLTERLAAVGAELAGGRAGFDRPGYADAVLDCVWTGWPQLRGDLARWLASLPAGWPAEAASQVAAAVVALCARQHDHHTLFSVAQRWIGEPGNRALGLAAVTLAGMSEQNGPAVRARLHDWCLDPAWLPAAVEICGGWLGEAFPHVALTRLRLAAQHGDDDVRARAAAALTRLAFIRQARVPVLDALLAWLQAGSEPGPRQVARRAWLQVLGGTGPDGSLLVLAAPAERVIGRLAAGWRELLRAPETRTAAYAAAGPWLENLIQNATQRPVILATLAAICRSEIDTGLLLPIISRCGQICAGAATGDSQRVLADLRHRISDASPLSTDRSLAIALSLTVKEKEDGHGPGQPPWHVARPARPG
jgi:hypothetical protein